MMCSVTHRSAYVPVHKEAVNYYQIHEATMKNTEWHS